MYFRILINIFFPPIRYIERRLIDILIENLQPEAGMILLKQYKQINYVQRFSKDKEVNFYRIKNCKPYLDKTIQFPNNQSVLRIASILFNVKSVPKTYRADMWLVRGYLFSIEFNQSPKKIGNNEIELKEIKLLADPMAKPEISQQITVSALEISGPINNISQLGTLNNLKKPIAIARRKILIQNLNAALPEDYLEIVSQTEGLTTDICTIYGLYEIKSLILSNDNYYILSEIETEGAIAVKQDTKTAELYFLDYDGRPPVKMGTSLVEAIKSKIIQGKDRT